MKQAFFIAALFLTVGCIDIPAMNGLVDRIVPEEEREYKVFEVWNGEGDFAPDPNQDEGEYINAIEDMIDCNIVACFQETAQNLSWREYTHTFVIESAWESSFVMAIFNIEYELGGSTDPGNGPSGTYDLTITDPDGEIHGDGYTMVTWDNKVKDRTIIMPVIYGTWTIKISGSGLDGIGSILYSGNYNIVIESDKLE
ncbi:MAG: hypothetical protein MK206_01910 [Candidatus Poseidoniia archaeon]|nr:hypothetical protein [Candidatus Poseidoniia archaeon]